MRYQNPSRLFLPAFFCLWLGSCAEPIAPLQLAGATMGTQYHLSWLESAGGPGAEQVASGVEKILEDINASMSTYREDSRISEFNRAPIAEWVEVDADFYAVFAIARQVSEASDGAYDVSVQPLVNLWGFGPELTSGIPSDAAIDAAMAQLGQAEIEMNGQLSALRKHRAVQLDFSSVAKGYAVDRLANWMTALGIENYLVEVGGELRVSGHSPRGDNWLIAIEKPEAGPRDMLATLSISNVAVATSGDYRNFFEIDGIHYSHTIDPRTGRPVRHELVSVTVVHKSAAAADAWATALTVLGPDKALAAATREQLAVYLVSRAGDGYRIEKTPAMQQWLQ